MISDFLYVVSILEVLSECALRIIITCNQSLGITFGSFCQNATTMSVTSSLNSFATSFGGSFSKLSMNAFQIDEVLDEIRLEEGDFNLPTVSFSEIRVNEIVTQGSFKFYHGFVVEESEDGEEEELKSYYALKCMKGNNVRRGLQWMKETKLLASLKHENIRNIYAVSGKSLSNCLESDSHELNVTNRYFQVVDTIQRTLKRKMDEWRLTGRQGMFGGKRNSHGVDTSDAVDRVKLVGHDVAKAMVYLHAKNVSFGPLTPDKIGYDCHGTLKLVSFSTAQAVDSASSKELYGEDIYSFGLLLWQLFTLQEDVNRRPPLNGVIHSDRLREMIKQCWDKDLDQRPKFRRITKRLLEATSDCRHTLVRAKKEEAIGEEYQQEEDRPPSIRNLFLVSPKSKHKKNFRISKVNLTLHLQQQNKAACDATVGTDTSNS